MRLIGSALAALFCCCSASAFAQATPSAPGTAGSGAAGRPITVELNRLEGAGNACRGYFLLRNKLPERVSELRLDVFLFDRKGVVVRRVGLTFPDLRPDRAKVVLFDLAEGDCADIGRVLVNDVIVCTGAAGAPIKDCAELIGTSTRTTAEFEY